MTWPSPPEGPPPVPPTTPPPYGPPFPAAAQPPTNTMAVLALVLAFVFAPAGIVCGHVAKRQIARTGEGGSGLATAGLVIGYLLTTTYVLACCGVVVLALAGA